MMKNKIFSSSKQSDDTMSIDLPSPRRTKPLAKASVHPLRSNVEDRDQLFVEKFNRTIPLFVHDKAPIKTSEINNKSIFLKHSLFAMKGTKVKERPVIWDSSMEATKFLIPVAHYTALFQKSKYRNIEYLEERFKFGTKPDHNNYLRPDKGFENYKKLRGLLGTELLISKCGESKRLGKILCIGAEKGVSNLTRFVKWLVNWLRDDSMMKSIALWPEETDCNIEVNKEVE